MVSRGQHLFHTFVCLTVIKTPFLPLQPITRFLLEVVLFDQHGYTIHRGFGIIFIILNAQASVPSNSSYITVKPYSTNPTIRIPSLSEQQSSKPVWSQC